jgi:hypothetical protein
VAPATPQRDTLVGFCDDTAALVFREGHNHLVEVAGVGQAVLHRTDPAEQVNERQAHSVKLVFNGGEGLKVATSSVQKLVNEMYAGRHFLPEADLLKNPGTYPPVFPPLEGK